MLTFYHGTGAQDYEVLTAALPDEWLALKGAAARLLEARSEFRAAELLRSLDFDLMYGTNVFGDEFTILYKAVDVDEYVDLAKCKENKADLSAFARIAATLTEISPTPYVRFIAAELKAKTSTALVDEPRPRLRSETVERALRDAQQLLQSSGPVSAVDRAHTSLHGYVRLVCDNAKIAYPKDASLTDLFKLLREQHEAFQGVSHSNDVTRVLRALATVLDSMNTLRNRGSVAHPNDALLGDAEAILVINCARTVLHYVNSKMS